MTFSRISRPLANEGARLTDLITGLFTPRRYPW